MRSCKTCWTLGGWLLLASSVASAQEPDVRDIPPFVMLIVDSSGSMEYEPGCACTGTDDCTNCEVECSLPNAFGEPPTKKKNRWAVTLEALTGKFRDFQCNSLARTAANGMTYDLTYPIPYHQPWQCASGEQCAYPGTTTQENNGILDSYIETLRFGLMTFDGEYTYKGGSDQIIESDFLDSLSTTMPGMWSTGGRKPFRFPGCPERYYVDSGARGKNASEGALISLDSDACPDGSCDHYEINAAIQDSLLRTRPYGGTPIAASLTDLYDHLKDEVVDKFAGCRKKYAILITDGKPDDDFHLQGCALDLAQYVCPYELAPDVARKLVEGDSTSDAPKQLDKLFVLGMSIHDADAQLVLDKIADAGGTTKALAADDPNTLRSTLDSVFSPLLNPISRSVPGFATGIDGTQYQISTGFQVSASNLSASAPPWTGLIERRRFVCNSTTGELEDPPLEDKDLFHKVFNAQDPTSRKLYTALPSDPSITDVLNNRLAIGASEQCGSGCRSVVLNDAAITPALLRVATTTERSNVINWMYGDSSTVRKDRKLGDIYHSSPTLVGPPIDEPADDAYTRFRDRPEVKERPLVMYIATNDGILHAIAVEDYPLTATYAGSQFLPVTAGEELWGFVPPILLDKLKVQLVSHQYNLDATPVVKDVFFERTEEETEYHTVLIMGMRGGGRGYFALDVTDPVDEPKFLWQFTDPAMGLTYGQPEIVQATFEWTSGGTTTVQTRAVAILPGGRGEKATDCPFGSRASMHKSGGAVYASWLQDDAAAPQADHRVAVQCWKPEGRALYFVDVATGRQIKKLTEPGLAGTLFPSPIVGTPTAYQDAVGTIADRGYVMDADGVLWRIDMSSRDPEKWAVRPFHDLFWDQSVPNGGETTYERPILSLDPSQRLVVIVGTGDTDRFDKPDADNRIVSLTEVVNQVNPDEPDDYQALINWELRNEGPTGNGLDDTELVTGSMALFDGQLFAATFIPNADGSDACAYGRGRLWSLDYREADPGHPNPDYPIGKLRGDPPTFGPKRIAVHDTSSDTNANLFNVKKAGAAPNLLIQGVGTTQRNTCVVASTQTLNSYFAPHLASIEQREPPAIWVVAQASGGIQRGASRLGSIQTRVDRKITFSRVTSWAASVD